MKIEDLADGLHVKWTITCPHCLVEFGGIAHRGAEGTVRFDPVCPKCRCVVVKLADPKWPPLPETSNIIDKETAETWRWALWCHSKSLGH